MEFISRSRQNGRSPDINSFVQITTVCGVVSAEIIADEYSAPRSNLPAASRIESNRKSRIALLLDRTVFHFPSTRETILPLSWRKIKIKITKKRKEKIYLSSAITIVFDNVLYEARHDITMILDTIYLKRKSKKLVTRFRSYRMHAVADPPPVSYHYLDTQLSKVI